MGQSKNTFFVCSAVSENSQLLSETLIADGADEAKIYFEKIWGIFPQSISGPFFKKKSNVIKTNTELKFKPGEYKETVYKGWNITAMMLSNPPNSAFVLFNKRVDGQNIKKPGTTIVRVEELENEIEENVFNKNAENA